MAALMELMDRPMLPLREAFDRLFESAFTPIYGEGGVTSAGAPTNIWETGDSYKVAMLVPGVDPESLEITALGNTITVAGSLEVKEPEGGRYIWQEFGSRKFRRQISLPMDVDNEHIEAACRDGVLLITVPKAEHARARSIKVVTNNR